MINRARSVAYAEDSSVDNGTSATVGSPYQASRSAKASLAASVIRWIQPVLPGACSPSPAASSNASCCSITGP